MNRNCPKTDGGVCEHLFKYQNLSTPSIFMISSSYFDLVAMRPSQYCTLSNRIKSLIAPHLTGQSNWCGYTTQTNKNIDEHNITFYEIGK